MWLFRSGLFVGNAVVTGLDACHGLADGCERCADWEQKGQGVGEKGIPKTRNRENNITKGIGKK